MYSFFKGTIVSACLALVFSHATLAQTDADILHFWSDRSFFSPAYVTPMFHASLMARKQQFGFKGEPFSVDGEASNYLSSLHSLFGLQLHYDYAGYTTTGKANLRYAFSVGDEYDRVNFGLSGGIAYLHYDEEKIKADNTNDAFLYESDNKIDFNCNMGVEWIHKVTRRTEDADEFTLGGSILNMEDLFNWQYQERLFVNSIHGYTSYRYRSIYRLDIYGGTMVKYYDTNRLHGETHLAVIKTRPDDGGKEVYDLWALGATYRHNLRGRGASDLIINAGVAPTNHLYVGLAYDVVTGNRTKKAFSSLELFVEYKFKNRACLTNRSGYQLLGGK